MAALNQIGIFSTEIVLLILAVDLIIAHIKYSSLIPCTHEMVCPGQHPYLVERNYIFRTKTIDKQCKQSIFITCLYTCMSTTDIATPSRQRAQRVCRKCPGAPLQAECAHAGGKNQVQSQKPQVYSIAPLHFFHLNCIADAKRNRRNTG